jgi:hypothetical protein
MDIKYEFTINLTPKDVTDILKAHFMKEDGLKIDNIDFEIEANYGDDRYPSSYPTYMLNKVSCTGNQKKG